MRILYIANARIPTEKAHGLQIMKTCEALAAAGEDVELVIPWRFNHIRQGPHDYYSVRNIFSITVLPSLDLSGIVPKVGFWIQSFTFGLVATLYALRKRAEVIYSRDEYTLYYLSFIKSNIFWESHVVKDSFLERRVLRRCRGVVTITNSLRDYYARQGIAGAKILVAPDAADFEKFIIHNPRSLIREELGLPKDAKIVMYTGHLYDWKGASVLLSAALNSKFKRQKVKFIFVGGTKSDIGIFRKTAGSANNVLILGHKPHDQIPKYLAAADVLVLPNSAREDISRLYTSPMKLFEYMASERPIVASDLPSLREILNEQNSVLVSPDDPAALAAGIEKLLHDHSFGERLASQALSDVQGHTWNKRARKIIDFFSKAAIL